PFACRIATPNSARGERLCLLVVLAEALFLHIRLYSPADFSGYDEFLHWVTANDILYRHKLFLDNSLLPVSPFYPALEILTTAFSNLAGLDVFPAGLTVLAIMRGTFVIGLFLFIEQITNSTRVASIAVLVYM